MLILCSVALSKQEETSCPVASPTPHLHTRPLTLFLWHVKSPSICSQCQYPSILSSFFSPYSQRLTSLILSPILYSKHLPPILAPYTRLPPVFESLQAGSLCIPATSPLQLPLPPSHLFSLLSKPILSLLHQLRGAEARCAKCHLISLFLAATVIARTFPLFLLFSLSISLFLSLSTVLGMYHHHLNHPASHSISLSAFCPSFLLLSC